MNILFVDHKAHLDTQSADFFIRILREAFSVETHYYDRCYHCNIPKEKIDRADVIVFWEFLADRYTLGVPGKRCVYVPMYDNEWGSTWQWRRIAKSGIRVISFCDAITQHARACGVKDVLEVHFAFDPERYHGMEGDPRKATLWERGQISFAHVKQLFSPGDLDKVTVFRRPEGGLRFSSITAEEAEAYHIEEKGGGFLPADEYRALQRESGVYVAPRWKEGIGMTVLEQMAMGKCVIAHDDATMSEYIVNGKTGILRDFHSKLKPIDPAEIAIVRSNVREAAKAFYRRWILERDNVVPFIQETKSYPPIKIGGFLDSLHYLAFWAEGCWQKIAERFYDCR